MHFYYYPVDLSITGSIKRDSSSCMTMIWEKKKKNDGLMVVRQGTCVLHDVWYLCRSFVAYVIIFSSLSLHHGASGKPWYILYLVLHHCDHPCYFKVGSFLFYIETSSLCIVNLFKCTCRTKQFLYLKRRFGYLGVYSQLISLLVIMRRYIIPFNCNIMRVI